MSSPNTPKKGRRAKKRGKRSKKQVAMLGGKSDAVRVVARFRPMNELERSKSKNYSPLSVTFDDNNKTVRMTPDPDQPPPSGMASGKSHEARKPRRFTFDRMFGPDTSQEQLFEEMARSTVDDVLSGFNGTVFAYGQTGSGKTWSMFGESFNNNQGIIPRSAQYIFDALRGKTDVDEVTIKVGFLEIYKENVRDLLGRKQTSGGLKVRETPGGSVYCEGLIEEYVTCPDDVMSLIERGESARSVAHHEMNAVSSRSHSVLIITLQQKLKDGTVLHSKLNMADLAGSERIEKTGATGNVLREAQFINQSLSALGNCIFALTDSRRKHVPFRDSKLTFLLKDSLGGNTKTTLLVACSPHSFNYDETVSTLKFAKRAKRIKNKVRVNKELGVAELTAMVAKLEDLLRERDLRIKELEAELARYAMGGGPVSGEVLLAAAKASGDPAVEQAVAEVLESEGLDTGDIDLDSDSDVDQEAIDAAKDKRQLQQHQQPSGEDLPAPSPEVKANAESDGEDPGERQPGTSPIAPGLLDGDKAPAKKEVQAPAAAPAAASAAAPDARTLKELKDAKSEVDNLKAVRRTLLMQIRKAHEKEQRRMTQYEANIRHIQLLEDQLARALGINDEFREAVGEAETGGPVRQVEIASHLETGEDELDGWTSSSSEEEDQVTQFDSDQDSSDDEGELKHAGPGPGPRPSSRATQSSGRSSPSGDRASGSSSGGGGAARRKKAPPQPLKLTREDMSGDAVTAHTPGSGSSSTPKRMQLQRQRPSQSSVEVIDRSSEEHKRKRKVRRRKDPALCVRSGCRNEKFRTRNFCVEHLTTNAPSQRFVEDMLAMQKQLGPSETKSMTSPPSVSRALSIDMPEMPEMPPAEPGSNEEKYQQQVQLLKKQNFRLERKVRDLQKTWEAHVQLVMKNKQYIDQAGGEESGPKIVKPVRPERIPEETKTYSSFNKAWDTLKGSFRRNKDDTRLDTLRDGRQRVVIQGYVYKQAKYMRSWNRRFLVLRLWEGLEHPDGDKAQPKVKKLKAWVDNYTNRANANKGLDPRGSLVITADCQVRVAEFDGTEGFEILLPNTTVRLYSDQDATDFKPNPLWVKVLSETVQNMQAAEQGDVPVAIDSIGKDDKKKRFSLKNLFKKDAQTS